MRRLMRVGGVGRVHFFVLSIVIGFAGFQLRASAESACTQAGLSTFRSGTYMPLVKEKKFADAARKLAQYMDDSRCFEALVMDVTSDSSSREVELSAQAKKSIAEYLWARSDLAYAYLMAEKTGPCLEITNVELKQYWTNTVEMLGDAKLKRALESNQKACEKKRAQTYQEVSGVSCADSLKGKPLTLTFWDEAGNKVPHVTAIENVIGAYRSETAPGSACVGLVEASAPLGLFASMCFSVQECSQEGLEEFARPIPAQILVSENGGKATVLEPDSQTSDDFYKCGEYTFSRNSSAQEKDLFRIRGGFSPCGGGTARGELDTVFRVENGKLITIDHAEMMYH